jgi:hypothetical protein
MTNLVTIVMRRPMSSMKIDKPAVRARQWPHDSAMNVTPCIVLLTCWDTREKNAQHNARREMRGT